MSQRHRGPIGAAGSQTFEITRRISSTRRSGVNPLTMRRRPASPARRHAVASSSKLAMPSSTPCGSSPSTRSPLLPSSTADPVPPARPAMAGLPQGYRALTGNGDSETEQALQAQTLQLCAAASLAVPLLLAMGLGLAALVRRVPVSGALVSGFQHLAVPAACLLALLYGGVLVGTARQEQRLTVMNRRLVSGGGRYFAARLGRPWPGPVR